MSSTTKTDAGTAKLYLRRNGSFGSSCGGTFDTGHHIVEDSGQFTVWDLEGNEICVNATRAEAENAIAHDWTGGAS